MEKFHRSLVNGSFRACRWCGSPHVQMIQTDVTLDEVRYKCENCYKTWWISKENIELGNDLFVMLNNNKFNTTLEKVEDRVIAMVAHRHDYPLWPLHDGEMDSYERDYHGTIRKPYYISTILLIQTLRALRNIS